MTSNFVIFTHALTVLEILFKICAVLKVGQVQDCKFRNYALPCHFYIFNFRWDTICWNDCKNPHTYTRTYTHIHTHTHTHTNRSTYTFIGSMVLFSRPGALHLIYNFPEFIIVLLWANVDMSTSNIKNGWRNYQKRQDYLKVGLLVDWSICSENR